MAGYAGCGREGASRGIWTQVLTTARPRLPCTARPAPPWGPPQAHMTLAQLRGVALALGAGMGVVTPEEAVQLRGLGRGWQAAPRCRVLLFRLGTN